MDGKRDRTLTDGDIETIDVEPGLTAPLDHVSDEERAGSTDAVDADTRDEPSMESSGTVDGRDATDPRERADADETDEVAADDSDGTDSDDIDGTDSGDDSDGDDASDDVDGTDTGDESDDSDSKDAKTDQGGDADDSDSEDAKTDQGGGDRSS